MSSPDQLIERISGGDPITGTQALHEFLALGDRGEEALFSQSFGFPHTVQVRRRWLTYIASRERTAVARLVDRMQNQNRFNDGYAAAYLFAGIGENREAINALQAQLETGFEQGRPTSSTYQDYDQVSNRFRAWGYSGGDTSTLWHYVGGSGFAWEKLATFAFRSACAAVARVRQSHCWVLEQFITHEWQDFELVKISDSPETQISHKAIDGGELWLQANDVFLTWRRPEVAVEILHRWSRHANWRVREFGALIIASLGFRRTVTPVIEWLRREPLQSVRISLLHALERSETVSCADALIEHFNSSDQEGDIYLAKAAWRASDKDRASKALNGVVAKGGTAGAEALVSLARLGRRHPQLDKMLESPYEYPWVNAALAVAYLNDRNALDWLLAMQHEVSSPLERVYLAAALAMLGKPHGAMELKEELLAAAGMPDFQKRVDLFFVHRYLQLAVLDGLKTGGAQTSDSLNAWRGELNPLDPIPQPIALAVSKLRTTPTKQSPIADVAILTILGEEYQAVCDKIENLRSTQARSDRPNLYAWKLGTVTCGDSVYSVAVGMMGRAGTIESALATTDAVEHWNPRYIFFAGIAGGLGHVGKGDVIIADVIHGYEYGKIDKIFTPRSNWTYKTDIGLLNGAVSHRTSSWRMRIQATPPAKTVPNVMSGEIASGDKVVDDPTNQFFAEIVKAWPKIIAVEMEGAGAGNAIEYVQSLGKSVSYMMIRGISDLPRSTESDQQEDKTRGTKERDAWKAYAADTAAAFTISFISGGLPLPPRQIS